jgi:hypothetical protein
MEEGDWKILHDWATNFRKEHNITTTQFLKHFRLPCSDAAKLYLYPWRRNILICMEIPLEYDLFKGLQKAMKIKGPFHFDEPDILDRLKETYQMNRSKLWDELGVHCCFFNEQDQVAECIIKEEKYNEQEVRTLLGIPEEWKIIFEQISE